MRVGYLESFFKELGALKRSEEFSVDILERIELLEDARGFIMGHSKAIKGHKPLMQLRYNDVRIFYTIEDDLIVIRGILKKGVDKFPNKVFEKMRNKKK